MHFLQIWISKKNVIACVRVMALAWALHAQAQILPRPQADAGSIQQQINRDREFLKSKEILIPVIPRSDQRKSSGGPQVLVRQFKFIGNTRFKTVELSNITSHFVGRLIEFSELEKATYLVAEYYRSFGYVVKVSLPPQDIVDGVVTMAIMEAQFGKVLVDSANSQRIGNQRILRTVAAFQKSGDTLNALNIERALAILSDLAGIQVEGGFYEGGNDGQTDLIVSLKDLPSLDVDVAADNTGARTTGHNRVATNVAVNSPLGMGDQFTVNTLSSLGSEYVRLAQIFPVGYSGFKLGVNTSHLNYRLITQDFSALMAKGTADAYGLESSYPFIRSRPSNVNGVLGIDRKHYLNQTGAGITSDYYSRSISLGINGTFRNSEIGGGKTSFSLMSVGGSLDLGPSPSTFQSDDASKAQTAGHFNKFKYAIARDQELDRGFSIYSAFSGQWASKNLDSSEKFYLGGIYGVRAYPSSEAGGALGQLANLEIRNRWNASNTVTWFYDYGRVLVSYRNADPSSLNKYPLKGYGLAYGFVTAGGLSLKATLARRVGSNPNPTSVGNDQDGSLVKNRLWLSASAAF